MQFSVQLVTVQCTLRTASRNEYVYLYIYTHTHTYICIYICSLQVVYIYNIPTNKLSHIVHDIVA